MQRDIPDFILEQLKNSTNTSFDVSGICGHSVTPFFDAFSLVAIGRQQLQEVTIVANLAEELCLDDRDAAKMYARYLDKASSLLWKKVSYFNCSDKVVAISKSFDISEDEGKLFLQVVGDTLLQKTINALCTKETAKLFVYNGIAYVLPHTIAAQVGLYAVGYVAKKVMSGQADFNQPGIF